MSEIDFTWSLFKIFFWAVGGVPVFVLLWVFPLLHQGYVWLKEVWENVAFRVRPRA